jgi:signal transduction histidine kinase
MEDATPSAAPFDPEVLRLHGFPEPGGEDPIRDALQAASAFCGGPAALALRDDGGLWYLAAEGLDAAQRDALAAALPPAQSGAFTAPALGPCHGIDLGTPEGSMGCLCVVEPPGQPLTALQRAGLAQLANPIKALVARRQEQAERRSSDRGPAGTTFVPGLVHEMRNFSFGISGSLDAFEARFGGQEETRRYGQVMRTSLDRLNAFLDELRDYGDPGSPGRQELDPVPLLREAVEHLRPRADQNRVAIRLELGSGLPWLQADPASLRTAFIRLLDLALQQESPGGQIVLRADTRVQGRRRLLVGHLDGAGIQLQNVDLARLFEPFYYRNSGLGRLALPTARRIFENHGGNLTASPSPAGGLRMGFMLPGSAGQS